MTQNPTLKTRQLKAFFTIAMTVGVALAPLAAVAIDSKNTKAWPKRDFLPPVATINPKIDSKQVARSNADKEVEEVAFTAVNSQAAVRLKPKVEQLTGVIVGQGKSEQMQAVLDIQKKVNEADLEYLWQATVEKNPVIRFSLEKLAAPVDLQSKQSSKFLSRVLSTAISGGTLASTMLMPGGGGMYQNMGTMAVGNALQNMVSGRQKPTLSSLSDTEQIQLAGLIDDLKKKLISSYQDYKHTLENLAQAHAATVKNNALYSKALASKNDLAVMATGAAYYQSLINETTLRQKAKLSRLDLERLAGADAVSRLELAAHVDTTTQTASNTAMQNTLARPVEEDELPYSIPEPAGSIIGPQPLIGPEPKQSRSSVPKDLPVAMELSPSFKADRQGPALPTELQSNTHRKLAEGRSKAISGLEPIEVLHP